MEKTGTEEDIYVTNRAVKHGFSPEPTETAETPHRPTLKYLALFHGPFYLIDLQKNLQFSTPKLRSETEKQLTIRKLTLIQDLTTLRSDTPRGLFETIPGTGSTSYLSDDTGMLFCTRFQRQHKEQEMCLSNFTQNKEQSQSLCSSCGPSMYSCSIAQQETSNLSITAHNWALRRCPPIPYADTERALKPGQAGREERAHHASCILFSLLCSP